MIFLHKFEFLSVFMSKTMQAQLELLAEVEAVFAAKNSQKLTKTQLSASWETKEKSREGW
jgi:hypothetical protein